MFERLICRFDLGAADRQQACLHLVHQAAAEAASTALLGHRQVVDPAAMALVPGHHRRDQPAIHGPDQEQIPLHAQLAVNVLHRVVPRPDQPALAPQRYHGVLIGLPAGPNP
ncbi:MAG: hypothetical protein OXP69_02705 [Spirochaetaceae bacterium]|nr:hypothetical protein [Spirochaetaceae bacterium]